MSVARKRDSHVIFDLYALPVQTYSIKVCTRTYESKICKKISNFLYNTSRLENVYFLLVICLLIILVTKHCIRRNGPRLNT